MKIAAGKAGWRLPPSPGLWRTGQFRPAMRDGRRHPPRVPELWTLKIPRPSEKLAGCVWLPRILSKARHLQRGTLTADYAANFCHPKAVDGLFLSHFGLGREDVISAATLSDDDVARWFLARTDISAKRVEEWNQIALNLGRPGYPMAERLPVALATTYKNVDGRGLTTVFEVLEADEKDA